MKKRLKTDGVDGLLEIVKAVQKGEDPEEMLRRKEAQRLEEEREAQRIAQEQEEAERAAREKLEEQEKQKAREKRQAQRAGFLEAVQGIWSKAEESLKGMSAKKQKKLSDAEMLNETDQSAELTQTEPDFERLRSRTVPETAESEGSYSEAEEEEARSDMEEHAGTVDLPAAEDAAEATSDAEEPFEYELSEDEKIFERLLERNGISKEEIRAEQQAAAKEAAAVQKLAESEEKQAAEKSKTRITFSGIKDTALNLIDQLKQRGISRKEVSMIGIGAVLAVLVIILVGNGINSFVVQKQKSENVTADRGLTVTVEKEPEEWCSFYPVELKFKSSKGSVTQVTVNGEKYLPDENGIITVETGEWLLETAVTLEDGTQLAARVEIPKLDAQAPVVTAQRNEKEIVLTAADLRSEIKGIYYGTVSTYTPWELPDYQLYQEPLSYTADTLYYFYAEDHAGNRSTPVKTTMETAEKVELTAEKLSLFPGESRRLHIVTTPENALLQDVRYESTDASIITVDGSGLVTAVAEGVAAVKVSVQGAASMNCAVTVSKSRSVTLSAVGDCTLGTDAYFNTTTNFNAYETLNGKAYFFQNVEEIFAADDVTFANLEGTFTTETTREMKEYAFKGDPSYTEILQNGSIEVVTLANNHSSDYGAQSLEDTKTYLTEAGIDYCIGDTIVMKEVNGVQMAFIGIYVLGDGLGREDQVRETIAQAKAQGAQLIITAFHWGSEKATTPDDTQTTLAHLAVDCGANLVVGHHPHVLQGIEKYNGVYIVYSLGNFCFGGNSAPFDMDTMIFQQTFTITEGTVQDDDQIAVIPCSISSTPNYNNYQPTPAQGTEAERIMEKINGYSAAYGQTYQISDGI